MADDVISAVEERVTDLTGLAPHESEGRIFEERWPMDFLSDPLKHDGAKLLGRVATVTMYLSDSDIRAEADALEPASTAPREPEDEVKELNTTNVDDERDSKRARITPADAAFMASMYDVVY